ncbi:MAG: hypothetical protein R3275_08095 [Saprospiraceae bacterium]|nr:hypothetical protein [Saprospiraceae bacterium]
MNAIKILLLLFLVPTTSNIAIAQSSDTLKTSDQLSLRAVAELGFLAVASHQVQFGESGTYFDYRRDGGQDVLFPVSRLSLELQFNERNTLYFLYQPLRLETQVLLEEDLIVDDLTFPANTGVRLLYNFPFYRLSYTRELFWRNDRFDLAIGGSLQIRNATISFESNDGTLFRSNRDIGLVPALKIKSHTDLTERFFAELEADGIYAPVSYLNGSDNEVVGAILDASLRVGVEFDQPVTAFLNLRYLGGGATGDSEEGPEDDYTKNWLHFMTVTAGFSYEFGS